MSTKICLMARVGLVDFAKCAIAITKRVVQLYRSKYSKHTYTQTQLTPDVHLILRLSFPKFGMLHVFELWNLGHYILFCERDLACSEEVARFDIDLSCKMNC